jgi:hypothetical protein
MKLRTKRILENQKKANKKVKKKVKAETTKEIKTSESKGSGSNILNKVFNNDN